MSQDKLGHSLGITFQQVQKYEKGVNRIGSGRLFELANVLGVEIPYFYNGLIDGTSVRSQGFAEEDEPPPVARFATTSEGLQLNLAFMRIADPKLRKRVLGLIKSLAGDEGKRSGKKAGKARA